MENPKYPWESTLKQQGFHLSLSCWKPITILCPQSWGDTVLPHAGEVVWGWGLPGGCKTQAQVPSSLLHSRASPWLSSEPHKQGQGAIC